MWSNNTGDHFTLVKEQTRLDVRKYSFSNGPSMYGIKLSTDCVHASNDNYVHEQNREISCNGI